MNKKTYITLAFIILAILIIAFYPVTNRENGVPNDSTSTPATSTAATTNVTIKGNKDIIILDTPKPNQTISSPLTITGQARGNWYFEATFSAHLLDANKKEIAVTPVMATEEWMTENYSSFEAKLDFPIPTTRTGTLVLKNANASGLPEHEDSLIIPLVFANYGASKTVKIYFSKSPIGNDCSVVNAVTRTIPNTQSIGKAAIEELLKGPTVNEKTQGYSSNIPTGTILKSLVIQNGVARADFSQELDPHGGACQVTAIRSAITQTLKQFPTVKNVVISINGKSEDILQP